MTSLTKMKTIAGAMAALAALASPTPTQAWLGNKVGNAIHNGAHAVVAAKNDVVQTAQDVAHDAMVVKNNVLQAAMEHPQLVLASMAGLPAVGVVVAVLTTRHEVPEARPAPGEQPAHEPTMAEVLGSLSDAELDSLDLAFSLESTFRSHGHPPDPNDKARAPFSNMGDDDLKAWMQAIGVEKSRRSAAKAASSNAPSAAK